MPHPLWPISLPVEEIILPAPAGLCGSGKMYLSTGGLSDLECWGWGWVGLKMGVWMGGGPVGVGVGGEDGLWCLVLEPRKLGLLIPPPFISTPRLPLKARHRFGAWHRGF